MLDKTSANQIGDNTCIKIYDPSRQKLIAVFENYKKAAAKLGMKASSVHHAGQRKGKTFCEMLGYMIAIRLSAIKEGDLERIKHCNRKIFLEEEKTVV